MIIIKVLICSGHTLKGVGCGASGYINESKENRVVAKKVVEYLKLAGHEAEYYEVNEGSDYLQKQVAKANSKKYDLVVQIHFNAHKTTDKEMGTETYYISESGKVWAKKVDDKLSNVFQSRGIKKSTGLYWLKHTKPTAILIEVCFVDSKADTNKYLANKNKVSKLIAEAINQKEIKEEQTFYRVVAGSYTSEANAKAQMKLLKDKGINGVFIDIYKK